MHAIAHSAYVRGRAAHFKEKKFLLCFLMFCVLFAERAVFGNSNPVGIVTLILETVVIPVLALGAFKGNFGSY